MEAVSHIGSVNGRGAAESPGRDLSSYRRYPATDANGVVRRGDSTSRNISRGTQGTQAPSPSVNSTRAFADVLRNGLVGTGGTGGTGSRGVVQQNNFFRLGSGGTNRDGNARISSNGSLFDTAGQGVIAKAGNGAVTSGHSDVALGRARGVFSERFIEANPVFSPPPRELPKELPKELLRSNGSFSSYGLPNSSDAISGELSRDLLQALQRYRVAAEIQG